MDKPMSHAAYLYKNGLELKIWQEHNIPKSNLTYKKYQAEQLEDLTSIGVAFGTTPRIVGNHFSKSVTLPVSCFEFKGVSQATHVFIRDNYYNIKCCVSSDVFIDIPMEFAHEEVDEVWLQNEIKRYINYTGKPTPIGDEWYRDWSSDELIREDGRIFRAGSVDSVYCEGIDRLGLPDEVFRLYRPGFLMFSISLVEYDQVRHLFGRVKEANK